MAAKSPDRHALNRLPSDVVFADRPGSERNLTLLREAFARSGSSESVADFDRILSAHLTGSPDPDMMLRNLLRFVEATVSKASLFNDLLRFPPLADLAASVFGNSEYFSDILVRDPELFRWLTASGVLASPVQEGAFRNEIDRIGETFVKTERRLNAVRRFYRREILRIGARDILGHADVVVTTRELSDLADAIIDAACRFAGEDAGVVTSNVPATPFCVIGLGKLGGRELNYSSDIDVIFVYGEEGSLDAGAAKLTHHEYFIRRAERIVKVLTESTAEGHLYRVDTRLRPEGGAGPLARSLESYLTYYESRGDLWERQMLIKARPVAGDMDLGRHFVRGILPFVYPRTHFASPTDSIARIKARIETEHSTADNVKLTAGGIRDIEFTVQALQLLHGGKNPEVRNGNTLESISRLREAGHLARTQGMELEEAYVLFRNLEHRLQMVLNTQTHTIPSAANQRRALAKRLGQADEKQLFDSLSRHYARVRKIFEDVLSSGNSDERADAGVFLGESDERAAGLLGRYRLVDKRRAMRNFRSLMTGSGVTNTRRLDGRSTEAFRVIAGVLLQEIGISPVPDLTLNNLAILGSGQPFPEQFYHQLRDSRFRALILRVCSISPVLIKALTRHPTLIDELSSGIKAGKSGSASQSLVEHKNREEARVGAMNLLGVLSFDEMTKELTTLADNIIHEVARRYIRSRKGGPRTAIFALGKYGTGELSFGGDLDLLFLTKVVRPTSIAKVEAQVQDFVGGMTEVSKDGVMYDVDARLRPEGKSAPLVTDFQSYVKYLSARASLWERQSLTRLRFLWGDEAFASEVEEEVERFVFDSPLPDDWVSSIVRMRKAMETRTKTSRREYIDVKLGPGGMVDIEFLAQMFQLRYGKTSRDYRERRTTTEVLTASEAIYPGVSDVLVKAYRFFRETEKLMRLTLEEKNTILPEDEKLETLARCLDGSTGDELRMRITDSMTAVRRAFLDISGRMANAER